ncbi:hypothetical protein P3X46_016894 [Hevea brasiliensis]|uniref:DUF4005 domain-containing protein n=1 Tax=Hevea brasiliensis TaxID=3981 RepID=A0ABQ9M2M1_HEVBR|nr:hypothetical protein P3X46_016894 [Hevea brasiliensis]
MGKKSGTSWFKIVKRAFRSPTKENEKNSGRIREEHEQEEEEKRNEDGLLKSPVAIMFNSVKRTQQQIIVSPISDAEQRQAIAVAAATAQAAVQMVRFTRPSNFVREHVAAMLQALVRGHDVRKEAKLTLKCMQSMVRVQYRVCEQRARLSREGRRKSIFAETNGLWESRYLQDIRQRKSISRDLSSIPDDRDDCPYTSEEIEATLQSKKEAASKRQKPLLMLSLARFLLTLPYIHLIWTSRRSPSASDEKELEEGTRWLDRLMATKQRESSSRTSADRREPIKTVETDTPRPCSYSTPTAARRSKSKSHQQKQHSPLLRAHHNLYFHQSPITPSPCKTIPLQVSSAPPRCPKQKCCSAAQTPSVGSRYHHGICAGKNAATGAMPNYMAATESAKAWVRSHSAPSHRPSTPERERGGSAKKHLSYPAPEPHCGIGIGSSSFSQNLRRCYVYGLDLITEIGTQNKAER